MKKAVITIATVFALVVSAEISMAAPQHGHSEPAVITSSTEQRNGADFALGDVAGGQMFGGLEFCISYQSTTLRSKLISANISTHAYDATLSALWVADSQLYVEGQFRYSAFDSDIRLNARDTVAVGGSGYDVSVVPVICLKPFDDGNTWVGTKAGQIQLGHNFCSPLLLPDFGACLQSPQTG